MKKICLVVQTDVSDTGVASYIKSIISFFNLNKKDFDLTIIATDNRWIQYYPKTEVFLNKKYINNLRYIFILLGLKKMGRFLLKKFDPFLRFLASNNYDLVFFPTASSLTYFSNSRDMVSVHDLMHIYERRFKESGSFLTYLYRQKIYKNISSSFNSILVDSRTGADQFSESFKCDIDKLFVLEFCCPEYIRDYGINTNLEKFGDYFFYPAAFWPHKNHKNLIIAFAEISNKYRSINLVFSGKFKNEYNSLIKLISSYKLNERIFFTGYVPDDELYNYYSKSRGLIMPSFYGPTNIPPIEAVFSDCPVMCSDSYGMKGQMENYAIYFNPSDVKSISKSMSILLESDTPIDFETSSRMKIKFSLERFMKTFKKYLNQL